MNDEEFDKEAVAYAVARSRDRRTRRWLRVTRIAQGLGIVVLGVLILMLFMRQEDRDKSALDLVNEIQAECDRGAVKASICLKADDVEKEVKSTPAPPGRPGEDGTDGADGAAGAPGSPGPTGPPGANGVDGADGADGAPGADGSPGPTGPSGPVGPTGPPGPQGSRGPAGEPGADGADGEPGADGTDGTDGRGVEDVDCRGRRGEFTFYYTDGTSDTVSCERHGDGNG